MLSEEPLFALNAADLTESEEKVWNIGRFLPSVRCGAIQGAPATRLWPVLLLALHE